MPSTAPSARGGAPLPDGDVLSALALHRDALRAGDGVTLDTTLARGARLPSERDLLVDLIAAEGVEPAAKKLARFWRAAHTDPEHVRWVSRDEAEVYERLALPGSGEEIDVVTLLRRTEGAGFSVVVTQRAPSDVIRAKLPTTGRKALDDTAITRAFIQRFGRTGELVIENGVGVFGHPGQDWLASVTPAVDGVTVALVPGSDTLTRTAQLAWLSRAIHVLAIHVGARQVILPAARKVVGLEALASVADTDAASSRALLLAWAALHKTKKLCHTSGLFAFGLPEVMASFADWGDDQGLARKMVAGAARAAVGGALDLNHSAVTLGGYRVLIEAGTRGPIPGTTFGRHGSIALRPLRSATVTESGVVQRMS